LAFSSCASRHFFSFHRNNRRSLASLIFSNESFSASTLGVILSGLIAILPYTIKNTPQSTQFVHPPNTKSVFFFSILSNLSLMRLPLVSSLLEELPPPSILLGRPSFVPTHNTANRLRCHIYCLSVVFFPSDKPPDGPGGRG